MVDPATGEESAFIVRSNVAAPTSIMAPSLMGESDLPLCSIEGGLLQVLDKTNLQSLSLYDLSGRLVMKGGESGLLDLGNIARGTYLLMLVRNGQPASQKIMLP